MRVINSCKTRLIRLPVYGAGADIYEGNLLMSGATAGTDLGVLKCVAVGANTAAIGVLSELHDYSVNGDALVAGSACWFAPIGASEINYPAKQVELCDAHTLVKIDYDLTGVAVTSSAAATVTVADLEDNIDTSFLYCSAGEGKGELRFVDTSASGSCTTTVDFTTLTNAGYVVKVLPLFHTLFVWKITAATVATKLDTTAAVGTGRAIQLERHILRNGLEEVLDPYTHRNLSGLHNLSQFALRGTLQITNSALHPLS